jgi:thiopurine S-methyltransferase
MDAEFWHQRWRDKRIGFHQQAVNPHLQNCWPRLEVAPGGRVFVPLCGKSLDMGWLAERHPVLGVELSATAVQDFYRENGLQPARREEAPFAVYEAAGVTLYCGDFFALQRAHTAGIAAVYDRAALIALPAPMRPVYAQQLTRLVPRGAAMLLITMEYEQAHMNGPPFSVENGEVAALFGTAWQVESLLEASILDAEPRFRERGLSRLAEHVYRLVRR